MTRYEVDLTDEQAQAYIDHWNPSRGAPRGGIALGAVEAEMALADAIRANPPKPPLPTEIGWHEVDGPLTSPQVRWWTGNNWRLSEDARTAEWPPEFFTSWRRLVPKADA